MAESEELDLKIRVVNEEEVSSSIDRLTRDRQVKTGQAGPSGGGGGGSALKTGLSTAVFNRLLDGIKSLESSIGSAFDAATSNAEKAASIFEGLGATISPGIAAAIKASLGPQVEQESQVISRVSAQLEDAARAIALSMGPDASSASVRTAIKDKLGNQIDVLSDIARRSSVGSIQFQQELASRSKGITADETLSGTEATLKGVGVEMPLAFASLKALIGDGNEEKKKADKKQLEATERVIEAVRGESVQSTAGGGISLGDDGS